MGQIQSIFRDNLSLKTAREGENFKGLELDMFLKGFSFPWCEFPPSRPEKGPYFLFLRDQN